MTTLKLYKKQNDCIYHVADIATQIVPRIGEQVYVEIYTDNKEDITGTVVSVTHKYYEGTSASDIIVTLF